MSGVEDSRCPICRRTLVQNGSETAAEFYRGFNTSIWPKICAFVIHLYNVEICQSGHATMTCKKCGKCKSYESVLTHLYSCSKISQYADRHSDTFVGTINGCDVYMNMNTAIVYIPHLICLKINYSSLLDDDYEHHKTYRFGGHNYLNLEQGYGVIGSLLSQAAQCTLCEQYYDSFPTADDCIVHLARCSAPGSVGLCHSATLRCIALTRSLRHIETLHDPG